MTEDDFAQIESKIDGVTGTSPVFGAAGSTKTLKGIYGQSYRWRNGTAGNLKMESGKRTVF